ncbi:MAG: RHS repeat-associated core domain-containing protein [Thermoanaerobaculia bacterium]
MLPGIAFAGNYTISWTPEPLGFLGFPTTFWNDAYVETALSGIVTVLNRAIESLLEYDAVLIPTLLGAPITVTVRDGASGFVLYQSEPGDLPPPPGDGGIAEIPPAVFGDTTAPFPFAGSPLRLFVLDAAEAAGGELDRGVSYLFLDDTIEIHGATGAAADDVRVRLLGLDDALSSFTTSASDGSFELQESITDGNRYLLALGARIDATAALEIEWSEPLGDVLGAVRVLDDVGHVLGADVDFGADRSVVVVTPRGGWPTDRDLRLELGESIADSSGNSWDKTLELDFRARASQVVGHYPFEHVYDVARLGSLLFLAAGQQGLAVLDAADPSELANVMPGGLTFPLPYSDVVRAVAVDPHGRVLVAGGGIANFGVLRIFDPLALPEILAAPDPATARGLAWRGTTIVSDRLGGTGTQLPAGTPRKVTLYSDDLTSRWRAGEPAPDGLVATFTPGVDGAPGELSVTGNGAASGAPVSLRNLTRGVFSRSDADSGGGLAVAIAAASGDRVQLLRNRATIAYLATLGAGVEAVDVNAFYHGPDDPTPAASRVVGIYSGSGDSSLELCNEAAADLASALIGLDLLVEATASPPIDVAALVSFRGIAEIESPPASVGNLSFLTDACAEVEGSRAVRALAAAVDFPWDTNADGRVDDLERERDYAFVTHATGGLLAFDLTRRSEPQLVARVRLPLVALGVSIDQTRMRAYVSGASGGLAIVELASLATTTLVDADENGVDDRVLEVVPIPEVQPGSPAVVEPDLGLVFVGGDGGAAAIAVGAPKIVLIAADGSNRRLTELAPLGVPSRNVGTFEAPFWVPASFRIRVALPSTLGPEVRIDVAGVGPGGEPLDDAGDLEGLPGTRFEGDEGVVLHRLSEQPWEEGSQIYESDTLIAVADLRAAKAYTRSAREKEPANPGWCVRCDRSILGIPESAREILSGDAIRVSFPEALLAALAETYDAARLSESAATVASVRWETAPSLRQEPAQSPSLGSGDVVPGTLLHSGEFSLDEVDLAARGRGPGFAFARTYRNQTVGGGPLGPGWDHAYRLRLRRLPNDEVELYDGRGRRETFKRFADDTLESPAGLFVDLSETADGFLLVTPSHTAARFDISGRLTSLYDAAKDRETRGNEMRFFYDAHSRLTSVLDALGREYELAYDDAGRLTSLTDFDQREVVYSYDAEGRLESVRSPEIAIGEATFPQGLTTTYGYATPAGELAGQLTSRDNLTSVSDPRGETPVEITYTDADGDERADEATGETWGGHALSIAYDFASHATVVTDRRGNPWTYQHGETGQALRIEDPTSAATQFEIDTEGLVKKVTKPLGGITAITFDTEGPRRSRGNALSVAVTADSRGDNGSSHTLTTAYEYEEYSNQPTKVTDPRGAITEIVRNEVGLPTSITEALGAPEAGTTAIAYNDLGQPTTVTNPNGHVTSYAYFETGSSKGYLQKQTVDPDGLGLETTYETDPRGNVQSVTDPRGVRHESTWNEVDWLVETIAAASASSDGAPALSLKTTYLHDEIGNVLEEHIPFGDGGGSFTRVERDYGVLNEVKEERREIGAGEFAVTALTYDESFNVATIREPEGQYSTFTNNSRGLPEFVDRGVGSAEAVQEIFAYDAEGQRTAFTNGGNYTTLTEYDGFGRVAKGTDPLGNYGQQTYDNASNPLDLERFDAIGTKLAASSGVFDLRGRRRELRERLWSGGDSGSARDLVTSLAFDALGNVSSITDPKNRMSLRTYDAAERATSATDPAGNSREWTLDRLGNPTEARLTEQVSGGGPVTSTWTSTFDALGRTLSFADPLGHATTRTLDARGNPRFTIDPDGYLTESTFDGLDRVQRTVRPEGVTVDYGYDRSSRLVSYRDALAHTTSYQYDPLNRLQATIYPDQTQQTIGYDGAGNPSQIADANGNATTQIFDAANRLQSRAIALGAGVEGPTSESFNYDGLSRLISAQSGLHTATRSYDSLSRLLSDGQNGRAVGYERDDAGNATQLTYPSGAQIVRGFDALDRLQEASLAGQSLVTYGFRGPDLIASKQLGNGLSGTRVYDGARRLTESSLATAEARPYHESITWNARDLKSSIERGDLNGQVERFHYDGAQRLTGILRDSLAPFAQPLLAQSVPGGRSSVLPFAGELPGHSSFTYDAAQALIARTEERHGVATPIPSPSDLSGRNRPASVGSDTLAWDANGNLLRKGNQHYFWDFRNRLTRVTQDGTGEIARYEYDAFNRLAKRVAGSDSEELVWNGWQLIERHKNGQLESRRVYGAGLDEVVREERDNDGDGTLEAIQVPIYDSIGNPVAITGTSGIPIERRSFSAYGQPTFTVDPHRPQVEQLREASGTLLLEFSEEILFERIQAGIAAGEVTLTDTTDNAPIAITADQPIRDGKQRGRRLVLTPDPGSPPVVNHGMRLRIEPETVVDLFDNELEAPYEKLFVWLGANHVKEDTAAPRVELVTAKQGSFELQFRETIDPVVADATILLDGQTIAWTANDDGYTLTPTNAISATTHTLQIGPALIDLAGNSLAAPFSASITTGGADKIVYEAPNERVVATPPTGNLAGFQGHLMDPATGLVYARNRWIDPEMDRFISADPMGYVDGPGAYQFGANDPVNGSDPMGLYEEDVHRHLTVYLAMKAGFNRAMAERIGAEAQGLDLDERDAMYGGGANNENMTKYHFASPQRLLEMRRIAFSGSSLDSSQLRSIGEFLHAWEDSYSHQADDEKRDFSRQYHDSDPISRQDIGHGLEKHEPDWTWGKRAGLALAMAETTYKQLVAMCKTYAEECTGELSDYASFSEDVEIFVKYKPRLYNDVFVARGLKFQVPDVSSYEEKVRLLDQSFTTEGTPEAARRGARMAAAAEREQESERRRQQQLQKNMDRH